MQRDVKPQNILLDDESGRAMLTDFGIAKARAAGPTVTQAGGVVGAAPAHMSPEQAAGREELDGRSDLYSLGIVLYALLAGELPFDGKDVGDVLVKHLTQEPVPLKQARTGVPEDLAAQAAWYSSSTLGQCWGFIVPLLPPLGSVTLAVPGEPSPEGEGRG